MKVTKSLGLACGIVALIVSSASAQFSWTVGPASSVTPGAVGAEVPANAQVFRLFANSGTERLVSWQDVQATVNNGTIYNNSFGSNTATPNPALVVAFPALAADSWVNMKGDTSTTTGMLTNQVGDDDNAFGTPGIIKLATWADTNSVPNDGTRPFAQLTVIPTAGEMTPTISFVSGSLQVAAAGANARMLPGSDLTGITIGVPEPGTCIMVLAGCLGLIGLRRRFA